MTWRKSGAYGSGKRRESGAIEGLSPVPEAGTENVEELADTDQAFEAEAVAGVEDAADHPERPAHTHDEYGRPDDIPPKDGLESPALESVAWQTALVGNQLCHIVRPAHVAYESASTVDARD